MSDYEIAWRLRQFGHLACDGCPMPVDALDYTGDEFDIADALLAEGWRANEETVYCPDCAKRESLQ